MSNKQKQKEVEQQEHEAKERRLQAKDAFFDNQVSGNRETHKEIVARLQANRDKDTASGRFDISFKRRVVMGADGEVVMYARQARKMGEQAIEFMKQGNERDAAYFEKQAFHLAGNALATFYYGLDCWGHGEEDQLGTSFFTGK